LPDINYFINPLAVLLSGTALAGVALDLGNAEGMPGNEVQIPIF
jgi:hypothetical protein